jgi:hypothetical protein
MMEAVRTSETSVDNLFTRQYNPEDSSELHTRRRENLKSHMKKYMSGQCFKKNASGTQRVTQNSVGKGRRHTSAGEEVSGTQFRFASF